MVQYAEDLLMDYGDNLDIISRFFLRSIISTLDDIGCWEWNLRFVGIITAVFLACIRILFQKKYGIDWYAFTHAIISGCGSIICVYLNIMASPSLSPDGYGEPLRSVLCMESLTSLHRVLPAITMGYSLFDLLDGLTLGLDFALHGAATLCIMIFFVEYRIPAIITPMLLMEVSTIFLTIVRCEFFTPLVAAINQGLFAITFFIFRAILVPFLWAQLMQTIYQNLHLQQYQECFPKLFFPICMIFGLFFHILNAYWFSKIIKKARRKILGIEKVKTNNDLKDK